MQRIKLLSWKRRTEKYIKGKIIMKTIATKSSIVFAWMLLTLQIEAQEFLD